MFVNCYLPLATYYSLLMNMKREWIGLILGVWIMISPWIFGVDSIGSIKWSNVLVGLALVVMSAWKVFESGKAEK